MHRPGPALLAACLGSLIASSPRAADPADRDRLLPAYDSGDHLHPNDAGMRAMVRAIRLSLLPAPACAG